MPEVIEFVGFPSRSTTGAKGPVPLSGSGGQPVAGDGLLQPVTDISGGVQLAIEMAMTVEGAAKPACVATILIRKYT